MNPQYALARVRLIQYFEKKEYNKVSEECWYILNKILLDRLSYDEEKKILDIDSIPIYGKLLLNIINMKRLRR